MPGAVAARLVPGRCGRDGGPRLPLSSRQAVGSAWHRGHRWTRASPPLPGLPWNVGRPLSPKGLTTALIPLKIPKPHGPLAAWAGRASAFSFLTKRSPPWVAAPSCRAAAPAPPGGRPSFPPDTSRVLPPRSEVGKGPGPGRRERPGIEPGPWAWGARCTDRGQVAFPSVSWDAGVDEATTAHGRQA